MTRDRIIERILFEHHHHSNTLFVLIRRHISVKHFTKEQENLSVLVNMSFFIHFSLVFQLERRAPFGVSVITHTIHTVGLLWTSDQQSQRTLRTQDSTTYKHKRQTSMPRAVFEPAIPVTARPLESAIWRCIKIIFKTIACTELTALGTMHVPYIQNNIMILKIHRIFTLQNTKEYNLKWKLSNMGAFWKTFSFTAIRYK
jgi:hypothetical protein